MPAATRSHAKLAGLGYQTQAGAAELQKGNFKAWASACAESVAAGSSAQYLRALLTALSEKTGTMSPG